MVIGIMGASGNLGKKTLDAVLHRGIAPTDIVALVRHADKLKEYVKYEIGIRWADYDDPSSMMESFQGIERILLIPTTASPAERVRQYYNAISAARKTGTDHLLHYGMIAASLESPFLVTPFLLYAESALRTSGLNWTILRNSFYADSIAQWVPDILRMGTIPYPTGEGRCSYVSRDDIARAGAVALTTEGHENKIYKLTGPEALTTADLCRAVTEVTGHSVRDNGTTDLEYIQVCKQEKIPEDVIRLLLTMYHTIRNGFLDVVSDDIERLTGRPAERFEDYLRRSYK